MVIGITPADRVELSSEYLSYEEKKGKLQNLIFFEGMAIGIGVIVGIFSDVTSGRLSPSFAFSLLQATIVLTTIGIGIGEAATLLRPDPKNSAIYDALTR